MATYSCFGWSIVICQPVFLKWYLIGLNFICNLIHNLFCSDILNTNCIFLDRIFLGQSQHLVMPSQAIYLGWIRGHISSCMVGILITFHPAIHDTSPWQNTLTFSSTLCASYWSMYGLVWFTCLSLQDGIVHSLSVAGSPLSLLTLGPAVMPLTLEDSPWKLRSCQVGGFAVSFRCNSKLTLIHFLTEEGFEFSNFPICFPLTCYYTVCSINGCRLSIAKGHRDTSMSLCANLWKQWFVKA